MRAGPITTHQIFWGTCRVLLLRPPGRCCRRDSPRFCTSSCPTGLQSRSLPGLPGQDNGPGPPIGAPRHPATARRARSGTTFVHLGVQMKPDGGDARRLRACPSSGGLGGVQLSPGTAAPSVHAAPAVAQLVAARTIRQEPLGPHRYSVFRGGGGPAERRPGVPPAPPPHPVSGGDPDRALPDHPGSRLYALAGVGLESGRGASPTYRQARARATASEGGGVWVRGGLGPAAERTLPPPPVPPAARSLTGGGTPHRPFGRRPRPLPETFAASRPVVPTSRPLLITTAGLALAPARVAASRHR